ELQAVKVRVHPVYRARIAASRRKGVVRPGEAQIRRRANAERIADVDDQARRAPPITTGAVLDADSRRQDEMALGLDAEAVKPRLVDAARLLAGLGTDRPVDIGSGQAQHVRLDVLSAALVQLAGDRFAIDHGPAPLVRQHEIGAGESLLLAPAF